MRRKKHRSESGPEKEPEKKIDEKPSSFGPAQGCTRRFVLGVLVGTVVGGGLWGLIKNPDGEVPEPEEIESLPEDPYGRIILDDSWRTYAAQKHLTLLQIGQRLFLLFHRVEEQLLQYYPALPNEFRIRVKYEDNSISSVAAHMRARVGHIVEERELVFRRDPEDNLRMVLYGLEEENFVKIIHEYAHVFNHYLGITPHAFLNEGIAEYFQTTLGPALGIQPASTERTEQWLRLFPELAGAPLRFFYLEDSDADWGDTLTLIQYEMMIKFLKDYENQDPGFLKRWFTAIHTDRNNRDVSGNTRFPTLTQLSEIGNRVSPGFYDSFGQLPGMLAAIRQQESRMVRAIMDGGSLYIINLQFGRRTFPSYGSMGMVDILPAPPLQLDVLDIHGQRIERLELLSQFSILPISSIDSIIRQRRDHRDIGSFRLLEGDTVLQTIPYSDRH